MGRALRKPRPLWQELGWGALLVVLLPLALVITLGYGAWRLVRRSLTAARGRSVDHRS